MFKHLTRCLNTFIEPYPTQTGYASFEFWPIWVQYDSNCWKLSYFSIYFYSESRTKCLSIGHGVLTHLSSHIPLRLATPLLNFWPLWEQYDSNCWKVSYYSIYVYSGSTTICFSIWHGVWTHLSNHIPLRLATPLLSSGQSECNMTLTVESSHTSQYTFILSPQRYV